MSERYDVDISYRSQWIHAGGYCGECSLQTIALKVSGMYVSQELVRQFAKNRELLVGPPHMWGEGAKDHGFYAGHVAAEIMNLSYDIFPTDEMSEPQQQAYYDWCKAHLRKGNFPIICYSFGGGRTREVYIEMDGIATNGDYHHIVNLAGIIEGTSWKEDTLLIHDHLDDMPLPFPMRYMHGKIAEPHPDSDLFPGFFYRCYGMSITGRADQVQYEAHVSLCVNYVGNWRECKNEPPFEEPKPMVATVFVSNTTPGLNYRIIRSKVKSLCHYCRSNFTMSVEK